MSQNAAATCRAHAMVSALPASSTHTSSCAGTGKILLLRRAGNVYASGELCLPSGHLEDGKNILQAAVRETREETSITLDPAAIRLVLSIHQRNPGTTHTRFGFVFEPDWWDGEPVNRESAKCSGLVWADPGRLLADTVEYTAAILRAIQRARLSS